MKLTVFVDELPVSLNRKEHDLLLLFVTNKNRVIKKSALAEHVWGDQADSYDFIYSQLKNLRNDSVRLAMSWISKRFMGLATNSYLTTE